MQTITTNLDIDLLLNIIYTLIKPLVILACMILIDTILGISKATLNGEFSSSKFRSGIGKCLEYFAFIFAVLLIQWLCPVINDNANITQIVIIFVIIIEFTSIVENVKEIPVLYNFGNTIISKLKDTFSTNTSKEYEQITIDYDKQE